MKYLHVILKLLLAILFYAESIVGFCLAAVEALWICKDHEWIEFGSGRSVIWAAIAAITVLALYYLAQVILWGIRGRILSLRLRLVLDLLFALCFSFVECLMFGKFKAPVPGILFLFSAAVLCVADLLMTLYIRWVDPAAARRRKPVPPPAGPSTMLVGPFPEPIRPAPRTHE